MNKLEIFKGATSFVASVGVSSIVGNAIKLTTVPEAKLPKRIAIGLGGMVLSFMISDLAEKYVEAQIDGFVARVDYIFHPVAKDVKENPENQEDDE